MTRHQIITGGSLQKSFALGIDSSSQVFRDEATGSWAKYSGQSHHVQRQLLFIGCGEFTG